MTASNAAAPKNDETNAASPQQNAVKQWFRGEIEASYYGIPSRAPAASSDSIGRRYRLHIYRVAMLRAETIDDPNPIAQSQTSPQDVHAETVEPFFQESIAIAQLWGVRGPGTRYEGPIHDVSIAKPQTRFQVMKDGKSYGTMRGYAQGWLYLPPSPAIPEPTPLVEVDHTDRTPGVLIHEASQVDTAKSITANQRAPAANREHKSAAVVARDVVDVSIDDTKQRKDLSEPSEPPFFSLCAAVGLLLWFTCGAEQTSIWCLFMLPTLGMRRLLLGVLPDERGVQAFAAVVLLGAILSAGTIFASFNAQNCWALGSAPLAVLVGSVFLSGIVPYRIPLAITALTFASVLFVWGHSPQRHCAPEASNESLPTIKDPGVPRTNDDGTWPRRVTTGENSPEEKTSP